MKYIKDAFLVLTIFIVGACTFRPTTDPSRFYAITVPSVSQVRGPEKITNIAIENVTVPQSVDRPQMVIKQNDSNVMIVSEFDRWIENLPGALAVAVSENINSYAKNINARPGRNAAQNTKYSVSIDFVRFETEQDNKITLSAWWTISNYRGDLIIQKKTTLTADTPYNDNDVPDYDAIVAAQSELVAKLAYKIADAIIELQ